MPKEMEEALKRSARKKGLTGKRADRYIYGTMVKRGWRPNRKGRSDVVAPSRMI